jgi:hypothetical protein
MNHAAANGIPHLYLAAARGMTRLQAFTIVGPLVGFLVSLGLTGNIEIRGLWLVLIFAYIYGMVPALIACAIDWFFSSRLSRCRRVAATTAVTFAAFAVLSGFRGEGPVTDTLVFGAICALAAAVCSSLAGIGMGDVKK